MKKKNMVFLCISCLLLHSISVFAPISAAEPESIATTTIISNEDFKSAGPVHISFNSTESAGFTDDFLINLKDTVLSIDGVSTDLFSSCENNCSSIDFDTWSVGDIRSVEITGISPYVTDVKIDGATYGVDNGTVTGDIVCRLGKDEDNTEVIKGVNIEFLSPENVLYLHISNSDGSPASGAFVKGSFKQLNEDLTSTSLTDVKAFTADEHGVVIIPCTELDSEQFFDYEISTDNSALQGQTSLFLLNDDSVHYDVSLPVVNDSIFANEAPVQKSPLNATLKEIQLQPTYQNFDAILVDPSNCSILFEATTADFKIKVPLSDGFDTKFKLPEGVYSVTFTGDANYALSGCSEFDTATSSAFSYDVHAENILSVHKLIDGKEAAWKFIYNNKEYTGNSLVRYAVAKGVHYLFKTDNGVLDAVVSDISDISFDLSSGKYQSTSQQLSAPKTGDTFLIFVLLLFIVLCGFFSFYIIRKKIINKTK